MTSTRASWAICWTTSPASQVACRPSIASTRAIARVETYTIVPDNSRHVIDIGFKRDGTLSIGSEST
jgi:hypothetical protein